MTITLKEREGTYRMNEDGIFLCTHEDAELIPPCCNGRDCGCYGMYSVSCPNWDCTDITDEEVNDLIDSLMVEPEEDY